MSAAEDERWAMVLYGIAAVTLAILVVVFIRAGLAERQRKQDELDAGH
jgi:hypothetical protein